MKHKVRLTVIDKKLYPELQQQYCADPNSGACPCYNVGDVFEFYRDEENDHFWHSGMNTLVKTTADPDTVAGGPKIPHCSELWDAISRYIYTGLQGGSIMKGWMAKENEMIACCSDGTRPVIFKCITRGRAATPAVLPRKWSSPALPSRYGRSPETCAISTSSRWMILRLYC